MVKIVYNLQFYHQILPCFSGFHGLKIKLLFEHCHMTRLWANKPHKMLWIMTLYILSNLLGVSLSEKGFVILFFAIQVTSQFMMGETNEFDF